MTTALVLFSGGKDSTVALWWAREYFDHVTALSFRYPARPAGEIAAATHLSQLAGVSTLSADLPFVAPLRDLEATDTSDPLATRGAYVPMRNLLFYATAAYFAEAHRASALVGGELQSDGVAYEDATVGFLEGVSSLVNRSRARSYLSGVHGQLAFHHPLIHLSDSAAMQLGRDLDAPIEQSWSCLEDGADPCGACVSCLDRQRALGVF